MHEPSNLLHNVEIIHWVSLAVMAMVYTMRIRWLNKFTLGKDRSAPGNPAVTNAKKGGRYSLGNVFMPWAMESTRNHVPFYITFVVFHLGVVAGITLAFVSTIYRPMYEIPAVAWISGGLIGAAFLVALYRIVRRLGRPVMRLISSPDDYFSLFLLTVWFAVGAMTQAHLAGVERFQSEMYLIVYLLLTSFFLLYVPFSKISHYLYYPFTRYWIGKALGHRGSMPYTRG